VQTLRKGATGAEVKSWQLFLRGSVPNSEMIVDGMFNDATLIETIAFQSAHGLKPDGVVGPLTFATAMSLGFDPTRDDSGDENGPNWPPKPDCWPISYYDREHLFGVIKYVPAAIPGNPEAVSIVNDWARHNIMTIDVPQLVGVKNASKAGTIFIHKVIAKQTLDLFAAWESAELTGRLLTWDGSWVPRFVRGSRSVLSNHSWGTAFDINAQWNMIGRRPALKGHKGCVRELVQIAYDHGFYWLGWKTQNCDGMHFEAFKIM
jgi:hypothetical protein